MSIGLGLEAWGEFFVAAAGASAALAGLIIVAMSVSIDTLVKYPGLTSRAATAIAMLVVVTVLSLAGLIPALDATGFGIIAIVLAAAGLVFALQSLWVLMANSEGGRQVVASVIKGGIALVPFVLTGIGGVVLVTGGQGILLIALGGLAAVVVSVIAAWVLLVEVRR